MNTSIPATGHDDIDATIAGLIDLAVWRTAHPEVLVFQASATGWIVKRETDLSHGAIARAIADGAAIGSVRKDIAPAGAPESVFVERKFGPITLTHVADRDEVCTRRVVGTRPVQVPDPAAPLVTVDEEIVEWDCHPILAQAEVA